MNRTPIDAPPLTSIEEVRIRRSVHKHAFGWQQTSRLLATLDAAVSARQEAERVLERIANASRDFTIARYRYVHGTGGGTTDEQMDARTKELLDATEAAFAYTALARTREPAGEGT